MHLLSEVAVLSIDVPASPALAEEAATSPQAEEFDAQKLFSEAQQSQSLKNSNTEAGREASPKHSFRESTELEIMSLLEDWKEPERKQQINVDRVSVSDLLRFRRMHILMQTDYPFSLAFGLANNREACIESSIKVYEKLLRRQKEKDCLQFGTIAVIAIDPDGNVQQEKMKRLIRLLRPDREGMLTLLDFVKVRSLCWAVDNELSPPLTPCFLSER